MNNQLHNNHFSQLHHFLDQELKKNQLDQKITENRRCSKITDEKNDKINNDKFGDFNIIEDKLKALEVRLQKINKQNNLIKKHIPKSQQQEQTQQDEEFIKDLRQIVKQRKNSIKKSKLSNTHKNQQVYQLQQQTPVKNKLTHKTQSEAIIKTVQQSQSIAATMSLKKNDKKEVKQQKSQIKKSSRYSTAKKIGKASIIPTNNLQFQNKNYQNSDKKSLIWSASKRQSAQKKLNPSVSIQHLRYLQRELKDFTKQNIVLKNRISQLKGYEVQYWKMKDIFEKNQKLRKKQKIMIFKR